jgi:membrane protein
MSLLEVVTLFRIAASEWWEDDTFRLSASLAFYTTFSLAPVLLIAIWAAGLLVGEPAASHQLLVEIEALVGKDGAQAVREILDQASRNPSGGGLPGVSLVLLFLGATAVFGELQSALNRIWDVQAAPQRSLFWGFVRDRLLSFSIVLGVGFLLLVSLVLSAALSGLQDLVAFQLGGVPAVWRVLHALGTLAVTMLLFAMIYKVLPDVETNWRDVAVGAVVTALLFSLGKWAIGMYLGALAFSHHYGGAGSFVALLIWVYYSALICFFGAEFAQVYARRAGSDVRPQPFAVRSGRKLDEPVPS